MGWNDPLPSESQQSLAAQVKKFRCLLGVDERFD
jgi:hypothetical protein